MAQNIKTTANDDYRVRRSYFKRSRNDGAFE
ncbi:hypothetical protein ONQ62_26755 [Salmonella enterica subsp. enterica serovar Virginia]|nr:hypothetical protein [Salmonella enterica subsp. enterica serovar Virginia]